MTCYKDEILGRRGNENISSQYLLTFVGFFEDNFKCSICGNTMEDRGSNLDGHHRLANT